MPERVLGLVHSCPCGWGYDDMGDGVQTCRRCGRSRIWRPGRREERAAEDEAEAPRGGRWQHSGPLRDMELLGDDDDREAWAASIDARERNRELGTLADLV